VEESLSYYKRNLQTDNSGAAKHPAKLAGKLIGKFIRKFTGKLVQALI
jgi:hypothetical protein